MLKSADLVLTFYLTSFSKLGVVEVSSAPSPLVRLLTETGSAAVRKLSHAVNELSNLDRSVKSKASKIVP